ncbi:MAG: excinuclease ABC subunit UvrA [Candidatus Abyssobacteria bacterium SURF_5]|uniref:UvrABC system protein A n=1 Tax=Abyssobacteria bacterium (strain SURF_5) TaxID=2093360 RepID=A0A3A4NS75_ABYX5|nr:MAG: excinuclease ABC subunit UvrA [Candidatus Abyssubacteria bacterium SURF_5]
MSGANPKIRFKGIRVHNLKNLDLYLERNRLTVVTGVSGSGKSSLAFDTIYAEGQRRYVESLSAYARQFLEKMDKPDLDNVEGIPPAIAIQQKPPSKSSRSTVGTATEIYDYLRLLFARIGNVHCRSCGKQVRRHTVEDILEALVAFSGKRAFIIAPKGIVTDSTPAQLAEFSKRGFARIIVEKRIRELEEAVSEALPAGAEWGLVIDRMQISPQSRSRLADSLELAYGEGDRRLEVHIVDGPKLKFTSRHLCPECDLEYEDPFPQLFSFNSPLGACQECNGFGNIIRLDMDLVVPNKQKTLNEGAIKPWTFPNYEWPMAELRQIAEKERIPLDVPFERLSEKNVRLLMEGKRFFPGIIKFFEMLEKKKYKLHIRVLLSRFRSYVTCPKCNGDRLRPEALAVKIAGNSVADLCRSRVTSSISFLESLELPKQKREIADLLLKEIIRRLRYLVDVGLDYVTLDRLTRTLSGGESQRINLASCLGSGLTDTLYILDEPSIGMHPKDNDRLINILKKLRDTHNTVLVVEHDADIISAADEVVDLGPGAGASGGSIIFQGDVQELKRSRKSLTGQYLSGKRTIGNGRARRLPHGYLRVLGAREHNLKDIDVDFPLGVLTCVTGVSGSGKSTLVDETLYRGILRQQGYSCDRPGAHEALVGVDEIEQAIMVDQSPIGRTPRSNPITYMHAFSEIRTLFASTISAQLRQFTASDFSFNVGRGRCQKCGGDGTLKIEMQFLADVYITCDACDGRRYKSSILDVRYKDKTIHDVLQMTVSEACTFFGDIPSLRSRLKVLMNTGLGYLTLGQPSNVLSAGEAQRLKLAAHIAEGKSTRTLFIFDEPTTGLHFHDIGKLIDCFNALVDMGNTVVVIEHNMEVIKCADYVIDLGPGGGDEGGRVVAFGPPEKIAATIASHTGQYLKKHLSGRPLKN